MKKTYQDAYRAYALINEGKDMKSDSPFKVTKVRWDPENDSLFIEMYNKEHGIHVRYNEAYLKIALLNEKLKLTFYLHPDSYERDSGYFSEIHPGDFYNDNTIKEAFRLTDNVKKELVDILFAPWNSNFDKEEKKMSNTTYRDIASKFSLMMNSKYNKNTSYSFPFEVVSMTWGNDPLIILEDPRSGMVVRYGNRRIIIHIPQLKMNLNIDNDGRWGYSPACYWYTSGDIPENDMYSLMVKADVKEAYHFFDDEVEEKYLQYLLAPWNE